MTATPLTLSVPQWLSDRLGLPDSSSVEVIVQIVDCGDGTHAVQALAADEARRLASLSDAELTLFPARGFSAWTRDDPSAADWTARRLSQDEGCVRSLALPGFSDERPDNEGATMEVPVEVLADLGLTGGDVEDLECLALVYRSLDGRILVSMEGASSGFRWTTTAVQAMEPVMGYTHWTRRCRDSAAWTARVVAQGEYYRLTLRLVPPKPLGPNGEDPYATLADIVAACPDVGDTWWKTVPDASPF